MPYLKHLAALLFLFNVSLQITLISPAVWAAGPIQKTITKTEIQVPQADSVLRQIDQFEWKPILDGADGITLKDVLAHTEKNNPQVKMMGEEIATRNRLTQQALQDAATAYTGLIRQWLGQAVLQQQLLVQEKNLLADAEKFNQGEVTSITVLKSQGQLIETFFQLRKAQQAFQQTSQMMALLGGLNTNKLYFPKALVYDNKRYKATLPVIALDAINEKLAGKLAVAYRPEVKELEHSRDELKTKFLGLSTITPPGAIRLKELESLIKQAKAAVQGTAKTAYRNLTASEEALDIAYANMQLAEKAYYQVQVSFESGFSSERDILEVENALVLAQANYISSQTEDYLNKIRLIKEMGKLSEKTAIEGLSSKDLALPPKKWFSPNDEPDEAEETVQTEAETEVNDEADSPTNPE